MPSHCRLFIFTSGREGLGFTCLDFVNEMKELNEGYKMVIGVRYDHTPTHGL